MKRFPAKVKGSRLDPQEKGARTLLSPRFSHTLSPPQGLRLPIYQQVLESPVLRLLFLTQHLFLPRAALTSLRNRGTSPKECLTDL